MKYYFVNAAESLSGKRIQVSPHGISKLSFLK